MFYLSFVLRVLVGIVLACLVLLFAYVSALSLSESLYIDASLSILTALGVSSMVAELAGSDTWLSRL